MSENSKFTILAISGSLKSTSSNTTILRTISKFADQDVHFILFNGLEELPPFQSRKRRGK